MRDVRSKDTSENVTNHSTDTVDSKNIKTIVNVDEELELGGKVANDTTADSDDDRTPWLDKASGGSDSNETGDGTGTETDGTPLLLETVVKKNPGDGTA